MSSGIFFSAGRNMYDNTPLQMELKGFDGMVEYMETHRGQIKGENYVCGAMEFGPHDDPGKYPSNAHYRLGRNAKPTQFLALDIDYMGGPQVQQCVLDHIKAECSYAYETASSTSQVPRMRVMTALDREVSREERIALGRVKQGEIEAKIEALFGSGAIIFDPSVYRPEQPNYSPTVEAVTWRFLDAPPLKVNELLTGIAQVDGDEQRAVQRNSAPVGGQSFYMLGQVPKHISDRATGEVFENPFAEATCVKKTPFLLAQIESALEATPSDQRNEWVDNGHRLKQLDGDGSDEGKKLFLRWSSKSSKFDPADAERVWHSMHPTDASHEQIFCLAERYDWDAQAEHARIHSALSNTATAPIPAARGDGSAHKSPFGSINVTAYGEDLLRGVEGMPKREWKIPQLLLVGYISLIVGPGGVAKSMLQLIAAVSVATGRDLLGLGLVRQCNALVINNEDDEDELRRRIAAILMWFDIGAAELEGKFFTISGYQQPVRFAYHTDNTVSRSPAIADIEKFITERGVGALFVDPFISTHTAPENDNNAMNQVITIYKRLAGKLDIAINIAHHTRKIGGDSETHAGDAESGRGASSIKDAARAAVTIARMGQSTAKKLGIADDERGSYIRLDVGKMNFAVHNSKANWFKINSVTLPNSDTVGVPTPTNLDALFMQAQDGRKKWTAEKMAAAVSDLFPLTAHQVPWANVKGRFMENYEVGKSVAGDCITLVPQMGEPPIKVGAYKIWISRTAPGNGWMIHRQGGD